MLHNVTEVCNNESERAYYRLYIAEDLGNLKFRV